MRSIKDKINTVSIISLFVVIGVTVLMYVINNNSLNVPLISMYVAIPLFLTWFGTRKNGCGSCNQLHKEQS